MFDIVLGTMAIVGIASAAFFLGRWYQDRTHVKHSLWVENETQLLLQYWPHVPHGSYEAMLVQWLDAQSKRHVEKDPGGIR